MGKKGMETCGGKRGLASCKENGKAVEKKTGKHKTWQRTAKELEMPMRKISERGTSRRLSQNTEGYRIIVSVIAS